MLPKVSVVIPTRDRPALLERSVRSVLGQHYEGHIECLVVFDQAPPAALQVELEAATRTLVTLANSRTPGAAGARNTGVVAASGEFIAFCDDDDEWLPEKLALQVAAATSSPRSRVIVCGLRVISHGRAKERLPRPTTTHQDLLRSRCMELNPCTMLVSRDVLHRVGLFDEQIPGGSAEDYDWFLRAAREVPIVSVMRPLVDVNWDRPSWFTMRWGDKAREWWVDKADALEFVLSKHPELVRDRAGLARVAGQIAIARAGAGARREGRWWSRRALRADPTQPRGWLALLGTYRLLSVAWLVRWTAKMGRGLL